MSLDRPVISKLSDHRFYPEKKSAEIVLQSSTLRLTHTSRSISSFSLHPERRSRMKRCRRPSYPSNYAFHDSDIICQSLFPRETRWTVKQWLYDDDVTLAQTLRIVETVSVEGSRWDKSIKCPWRMSRRCETRSMSRIDPHVAIHFSSTFRDIPSVASLLSHQPLVGNRGDR